MSHPEGFELIQLTRLILGVGTHLINREGARSSPPGCGSWLMMRRRSSVEDPFGYSPSSLLASSTNPSQRAPSLFMRWVLRFTVKLRIPAQIGNDSHFIRTVFRELLGRYSGAVGTVSEMGRNDPVGGG